MLPNKSISIATGSSRLELAALEANAQRVGLQLSPEGQLDLKAANALLEGPAGGAKAVRAAAAQDHDTDTLSLAEVATLRPNAVERWKSRANDPAAARAKLTATAGALNAAALQWTSFGDQFRPSAKADAADLPSYGRFKDGDAAVSALGRLSSRLTATATALEEALQPANLAHATPEQVEALRQGLSAMKAALGDSAGPLLMNLHRLKHHFSKASYGCSGYNRMHRIDNETVKLERATEKLRARLELLERP